MTVIEKSPPAVRSPSPGKLKLGGARPETRRESRSPEPKDKAPRREGDLISTATSALKRLHFRSAGGSRTKKGQTTTAGGQSIPKVMVMGSSTTSETTTNTSTDSSNTVYTTVTVTDAEQEDTELLNATLEGRLSAKTNESSADLHREIRERRRMEKRHEMRRSKEILNEFDELFLENEKRIQEEEERNERKSRAARNKPRWARKKEEGESNGVDMVQNLSVAAVTVEDIQERRKNAFQQTAKSEKKSSESEEERPEKTTKEVLAKTAASSSEKDSDELLSSADDHPSAGTGAPPSTPLNANPEKEQQVSSKPGLIDEETIRTLELIMRSGRYDSEKKERKATEKTKSNVRTIQSELPQLTLRTNFNRKQRDGDQKECGQKEDDPELEKTSPKSLEHDNFQLPAGSVSPKPPSRAISPKFTRSSSANLRKLSEKPVFQESRNTRELAVLTASNLEIHEKQLSAEIKKQNRSKFDSFFNMDSPTTMKSSPPVDGFFGPTDPSGNFEFPSCISPTEISNAFACSAAGEPNPEKKADENRKKTEDTSTPAGCDMGEEMVSNGEGSNKRNKRSDRKSISMETPVKLLEAEEKIAQNLKTEEGYRDLILEDKIASMKNRKYSILATDGSIKNFVSENSEDFKKTNESLNENAKKNSGARSGSECPQRHRRVSIIQGDSLRHFIFEEPDTSRMKSSRRKMSMMPEDTTKNLLLDDAFTRKSSLVPGDTLRNLLGDEANKKHSNAPEEKPRKFSINTLGDIVSARKFSLLPPGEIYTSQVDGKTTEIIKLAPGTKGRPLATIVVQQASIQRGSISGPSCQKEDTLLDVANTFTLEELHEFDMKYGSPHHCRSQSVKTPGRSCGRPNYLCLPQQRSRVASMPNTGVEEEYYRLRHFSITGKGVVNRGDSLKSRRSRSNNSVASSNSSHSAEHLASNVGTVGSHPGSARTSAECSLASSRESSTASMPYKVVMLGGAGVGKSSLISQFMTSEYLHAYDTSLDEEYGEKSVSVLLDGEESELIFVDHPSSEMSPENCITTYEPQAYIVVYSVVDRSSLQIAEETLQSLWKTDSIAAKAVILVGNKTDLVRSRTVTTEEGKNMARSYDCKFIETSVGINHNVDELLVGILTQIRLKIQQAMKPKRNRSPLGSCMGKDGESPKRWRNSRLSASLKVKGLLGRVWARDSKSKSFSGEALSVEELDQFTNYSKRWLQSD